MLALALGLLTANVASGQSAEEKFKSGADLYFRGKVDEALKVFQDVLAENPSHDDALNLYNQCGRQVCALMLVKGGEFETTAKRFIELATIARSEKSDDATVIGGLVEKAMTGNYLDQRDALYALSANHGEYGAGPFVGMLGDEENSEKRVRAMVCLNHLSGDAVLPLLAGLQSGNDRVVRNASACLGTIGDKRAVAGLKTVWESSGNEVTKAAAEDALMKITGKAASALPSSADLNIDMAARHFRNDASVNAPYDTRDAVWNWSGSAAAATKTPAILRHLRLAEQFCMASLGDARAQAILLASYAGEKAAIASVKAMGAEGDAPEADASLDVKMASGGIASLASALDFALANDGSMAAVELIDSMLGMGATSGSLAKALGSNYKSVRYHAASALAMRGDSSAPVVGALGDALSEDALRTVLVVDDKSESRNAMAAVLKAAGYSVITADSGGIGFARARTVPPKDVVVLRAGMADVTVDQFIYDADFRTASASMVLVSDAAGAEALKAQYDGKGKVKAFITDPVDGAALGDAVKAAMPDLNHERAAALAAAETAAGILAHVPAESLGTIAGQLAHALSRTEENVLLGSLRAVGHLGAADMAAAAAAIFADSARSEAVRVAAAEALGGIFSKMSAAPAEDILKPVMDAAANDASAAVKLAAGRALGSALFLGTGDRAPLLRGASAK